MANKLFDELLQVAEDARPGFKDDFNEWRDSRTRDTEPSIDELLTRPIPSVIRGRGEWVAHSQELLDDYDQSFNEGYYYVVTARQGGGNDECWCETDDEDTHEDFCLWANNEELRAHEDHVTDFYDPFDSTYITHVFALQATKSEVISWLSRVDKANSDRSDLNNLDQVLAGKMTPWLAMSSRSLDFNPEYEAKKTSMHLQAKEHHTKRLKEIEQVTTSLAELPDDFSVADLPQAPECREPRNSRLGRVRDSLTGRYFEDLQKYEEDLRIAEQKLYDAETYLPEDSPLRKELLEDRGQGSYTSTEKRGRRNVKVRKTYDRGSVLGSKVSEYQGRVNLKREQIRDIFNNYLDELRQSVQRKLEELESSAYRSFDEIAEESFEAGWKGSDVPVMPDSWVEYIKEAGDGNPALR